MNVEQIQKRLDAMTPKLCAAGLREPRATILIRSDQCPHGLIEWYKAASYSTELSHYSGDNAHEILGKMDAWINDLPSPEERKLSEFMKAVAVAIDLGRENGIDADFVNPLTVLMKTLSENAITDHRVVK